VKVPGDQAIEALIALAWKKGKGFIGLTPRRECKTIGRWLLEDLSRGPSEEKNGQSLV
jgi:hypothetical protein